MVPITWQNVTVLGIAAGGDGARDKTRRSASLIASISSSERMLGFVATRHRLVAIMMGGERWDGASPRVRAEHKCMNAPLLHKACFVLHVADCDSCSCIAVSRCVAPVRYIRMSDDLLLDLRALQRRSIEQSTYNSHGTGATTSSLALSKLRPGWATQGAAPAALPLPESGPSIRAQPRPGGTASSAAAVERRAQSLPPLPACRAQAGCGPRIASFRAPVQHRLCLVHLLRAERSHELFLILEKSGTTSGSKRTEG